MSRHLRFVPEDGALVEVTCRTIHGRLLLRPSQQLEEIVVGILARAQRTFQVRVCGYCFASNHYHLLLDVDSAQQLAPCMAILRPCPSGEDSLSQVVPGTSRDHGRAPAEGAHGSGRLPGSCSPRVWRLGFDGHQLGDKPHEGGDPLSSQGGGFPWLRPEAEDRAIWR